MQVRRSKRAGVSRREQGRIGSNREEQEEVEKAGENRDEQG